MVKSWQTGKPPGDFDPIQLLAVGKHGAAVGKPGYSPPPTILVSLRDDRTWWEWVFGDSKATGIPPGNPNNIPPAEAPENRPLTPGAMKRATNADDALVVIAGLEAFLEEFIPALYQEIILQVLMAPAGTVISVVANKVGGVAITIGKKVYQFTAAQASKLANKLGYSSVEELASALQNAFRNLIEYACFAPETLVHTEVGLRPIGEVVAGERVFAFDFQSGKWTLSDVRERIDRQYRGLVQQVTIDKDTITVTADHPFWVVDGSDLGQRATCLHLPLVEDTGQALAGRWVDAQHLQIGDQVVCRDGVARVVVLNETQPVANRRVCCLAINEHHSFAVGACGILVHNGDAWCAVFLKANGGRVAPQALRLAARKAAENHFKRQGIRPTEEQLEWLTNKFIHAHHIVRKTANNDYVKRSQAILKKAGIKLFDNVDDLAKATADELHNITWAVNGRIESAAGESLHSTIADKFIAEALEKAWNEGGANGVKKLLAQWREWFEDGQEFWLPGWKAKG